MPVKGTILRVNVINSIAVAKVNVKMYEFSYDEFLSFHKIDNQWMIVNKMISDIAVQTTVANSTALSAVKRMSLEEK